MTYVYLLSDYEEHGPKNMVATLDRSRLPAMLMENWSEDFVVEAKVVLEGWLKRSDEDLASKATVELHSAWGGIQFSVVELVEFEE